MTKSSTLPIRLISTIVPGFGRGSRDLGIPTANISRDDLQCDVDFDALPCGIYWGFARIVHIQQENFDSISQHLLQQVHKTAISIGYNPCYSNTFKTVEPHLIAPVHQHHMNGNNPFRHASSCRETQYPDFYGCTIRLSVVGFLRPELPFESLEKLVIAIKEDICNAEVLCDGLDEHVLKENEWVQSSIGTSTYTDLTL